MQLILQAIRMELNYQKWKNEKREKLGIFCRKLLARKREIGKRGDDWTAQKKRIRFFQDVDMRNSWNKNCERSLRINNNKKKKIRRSGRKLATEKKERKNEENRIEIEMSSKNGKVERTWDESQIMERKKKKGKKTDSFVHFLSCGSKRDGVQWFHVISPIVDTTQSLYNCRN